MRGDKPQRFEIFAVTLPGLEEVLAEEVRSLGWSQAKAQPGGVSWQGAWHDIWRANLIIRGASRILVRLATFKTQHLGELENKARQIDWSPVIRERMAVRVDAVCRTSKIYHSGAAAERVERALSGFQIRPSSEGVQILVRIESNLVTISADTSGTLLHKRGFKQAVVKAPLRETMASLLLRACGYRGDETVVDPMCGSGTIPIEAAEIARGLAPGRGRGFAFEGFPSFLPEVYGRLKEKACAEKESGAMHHASDQADAAIKAARSNAERAGVGSNIIFSQNGVAGLMPPETEPGLILVNPPYGARIGGARDLKPLYEAHGRVVRDRFSGWRVGLVTNSEELAKATRLPFAQISPPIPHGPLKIRLHQAGIEG